MGIHSPLYQGFTLLISCKCLFGKAQITIRLTPKIRDVFFKYLNKINTQQQKANSFFANTSKLKPPFDEGLLDSELQILKFSMNIYQALHLPPRKYSGPKLYCPA